MREFEKLVAPCRVAVNESGEHLDVDFFLETVGQEFSFQLVEAMEPERRRGAEYKTKMGDLRGLRNAERGHMEGPAWIANAIALNAAKHYAERGSHPLDDARPVARPVVDGRGRRCTLALMDVEEPKKLKRPKNPSKGRPGPPRERRSSGAKPSVRGAAKRLIRGRRARR